jgi:hypothetical protein
MIVPRNAVSTLLVSSMALLPINIISVAQTVQDPGHYQSAVLGAANLKHATLMDWFNVIGISPVTGSLCETEEAAPCSDNNDTHVFANACCDPCGAQVDLVTFTAPAALVPLENEELLSDLESAVPTTAPRRGEFEDGCKRCTAMNSTIEPQGTPAHNTCHYIPRPGFCGAHKGCATDESLAPSDFARILEIADADGVAQYVGKLDTENLSITYSAERGAIQMQNCRGRVVLHIPVSRAQGLTVSRAVAELNAAFVN